MCRDTVMAESQSRLKSSFVAKAGDCNAAMPFAHRGPGPGGFEDQDINQARTQTNKTCIIAQNPELLSVFISGGTDVLIQRGSL